MPAILRIFLPNEFASPHYFPSFGPYAQVDSDWPLRGHRVYGSEDYAMSVGVMCLVRVVVVWVREHDVQTTTPACSPHPIPGPPALGLD